MDGLGSGLPTLYDYNEVPGLSSSHGNHHSSSIASTSTSVKVEEEMTGSGSDKPPIAYPSFVSYPHIKRRKVEEPANDTSSSNDPSNIDMFAEKTEIETGYKAQPGDDDDDDDDEFSQKPTVVVSNVPRHMLLSDVVCLFLEFGGVADIRRRRPDNEETDTCLVALNNPEVTTGAALMLNGTNVNGVAISVSCRGTGDNMAEPSEVFRSELSSLENCIRNFRSMYSDHKDAVEPMMELFAKETALEPLVERQKKLHILIAGICTLVDRTRAHLQDLVDQPPPAELQKLDSLKSLADSQRSDEWKEGVPSEEEEGWDMSSGSRSPPKVTTTRAGHRSSSQAHSASSKSRKRRRRHPSSESQTRIDSPGVSAASTSRPRPPSRGGESISPPREAIGELLYPKAEAQALVSEYIRHLEIDPDAKPFHFFDVSRLPIAFPVTPINPCHRRFLQWMSFWKWSLQPHERDELFDHRQILNWYNTRKDRMFFACIFITGPQVWRYMFVFYDEDCRSAHYISDNGSNLSATVKSTSRLATTTAKSIYASSIQSPAEPMWSDDRMGGGDWAEAGMETVANQQTDGCGFIILSCSGKEPLSRLSACRFDYQTVAFWCIEQAFHFSVALYLKKFRLAWKILRTADPAELAKRVGQLMTKDHLRAVFPLPGYRILNAICRYKFKEDHVAREALMSTGGARLHEGSKHPFFGCGFDPGQEPQMAEADRDIRYRYRDYFGIVLTCLRSRIHMVGPGGRMFRGRGRGRGGFNNFRGRGGFNRPFQAREPDHPGLGFSVATEMFDDHDRYMTQPSKPSGRVRRPSESSDEYY